jgi:hypothetical protein
MRETTALKRKESVLGEAADAETNVVRADVRAVPVAVSRAAVHGVEAPRAAAQQPE